MTPPPLPFYLSDPEFLHEMQGRCVCGKESFATRPFYGRRQNLALRLSNAQITLGYFPYAENLCEWMHKRELCIFLPLWQTVGRRGQGKRETPHLLVYRETKFWPVGCCPKFHTALCLLRKIEEAFWMGD